MYSGRIVLVLACLICIGAGAYSPYPTELLVDRSLNPNQLFAAEWTPKEFVPPAYEIRQTTPANNGTEEGQVDEGGTASVEAEGVCELSNKLSQNQAASWTENHVTTCCIEASRSLCFTRVQDSVQGNDRCTIPPCQDLLTNDPAKLIGFKPLPGGIGELNNAFAWRYTDGAVSQKAATSSAVMFSVSLVVVLLLSLGA